MSGGILREGLLEYRVRTLNEIHDLEALRQTVIVNRGAAQITLGQLAEIIRSVVRPAKDGLDPATRTFQEIRILVNRELDEVSRWVEASSRVLNDGGIAAAISAAFGSFEEMQTALSKAGMTRFGGGWAWLMVTGDGSLAITSCPNQDNPLMDGSGTPILGVDVWEHAYYKKYGPGRADYLAAWWHVVDWDVVNGNYAATQ